MLEILGPIKASDFEYFSIIQKFTYISKANLKNEMFSYKQMKISNTWLGRYLVKTNRMPVAQK